MWVHLDIVESQQWTTVTSKKSKGKAKTSSSNVVGISTKDTEEDIASLTSSGEESAFAANTGVPPTSKTRSGKQYLKQYSEPMVDSPQAAQETIEQSTRPSVEKQKELWYVKALQKGGVGPSTPFLFDVMAQLANIPTRITLYELLRIFKSTRDALREALADVEIFMTQIPTICGEADDNQCHHTSVSSEKLKACNKLCLIVKKNYNGSII